LQPAPPQDEKTASDSCNIDGSAAKVMPPRLTDMHVIEKQEAQRFAANTFDKTVDEDRSLRDDKGRCD
jgi:hypothetical protein